MNPIYFVGWTAFRALYRFYFRWRVFNPERVPLSGPYLRRTMQAIWTRRSWAQE